MKVPARLAPLFLLPALLSACTGTEEPQVALRVALLTNGGATLRTVTPNADSAAAPVTNNGAVEVSGGVTINSLSTARRLALTRAEGIESLGSGLNDVQAFAKPDFDPVCLTRTVSSAARDRLLTLSDCPGGPQRLALYREDGTLVWTARLPTFVAPTPGPDVPPVRLAVSGDVALVARPRLGGGSEVLRVAQTTAGSPQAEASAPLPTPAVRDLVAYSSGILAATDSGVQRVADTGVPDGVALAAFGSGRVDRLWSGTAGSRSLLAAWRSDAGGSLGSQPLRLWDGTPGKAAVTAALFSDLRDLTLAPDGYLYTLTASTLSRYDAALGLQSGNFIPRVLLGSLNDARAVIWLIPAEAAGG